MRSPRSLALAFTMLGAFASTSCFDPVHSDEVNALGGEVNGVGPGPLHRPGQPCRVCHGDMGPASPEFTIAGTVYAQRNVAAAKAGVTVTVTDANGATRQLTSNEAGNFFIAIDQWAPAFPVNVKLDFPGAQTKGMVTPIGRNGACGSCHYGADNELTHMPPVFLQD